MLEKKINGSFSFNISHTLKELIIYFKEKRKSRRRNVGNTEFLPTVLKAVDTSVIIATTLTSVRICFTGFGLMVIQISTVSECLVLGIDV